jgi:formamidopyrimidine-DNA glycosylase
MPEGHRTLIWVRQRTEAVCGKQVSKVGACPILTVPSLVGSVCKDIQVRGKMVYVFFQTAQSITTFLSPDSVAPDTRTAKPRDLICLRMTKGIPSKNVVMLLNLRFGRCSLELKQGGKAKVEEIDCETAREEIARLAPLDVCCDAFRADAVLVAIEGKAREVPDWLVVDMLVDQQILCGAGNVMKIEALFACRVSPFARVADLLRDELGRSLLRNLVLFVRSFALEWLELCIGAESADKAMTDLKEEVQALRRNEAGSESKDRTLEAKLFRLDQHGSGHSSDARSKHVEWAGARRKNCPRCKAPGPARETSEIAQTKVPKRQRTFYCKYCQVLGTPQTEVSAESSSSSSLEPRKRSSSDAGTTHKKPKTDACA